jgi:hypothetical protein
MRERYTIIRRNQNCDCIRFPYGLGIGFCGRPVTGYRTGRNLKIHFTSSLTNPEREVACIKQILDLTEAAKGDGYAISGGSIHGDSSSSNDVRSRPRWVVSDRSSDSSSSVPFDIPTSSRLSNGFNNLLSD